MNTNHLTWKNAKAATLSRARTLGAVALEHSRSCPSRLEPIPGSWEPQEGFPCDCSVNLETIDLDRILYIAETGLEALTTIASSFVCIGAGEYGPSQSMHAQGCPACLAREALRKVSL